MGSALKHGSSIGRAQSTTCLLTTLSSIICVFLYLLFTSFVMLDDQRKRHNPK